MKQLFGFVLLIATGLLLLTVITGMGGIFGSIANTWTTEQTAQIATGLSQVLWLGGIVTVLTLGYGLFVNMSKGSRGWSNRNTAQEGQGYYVLDNSQQAQQTPLLGMKDESMDWYDFQPEHEQRRAQ